MKFVKFVDNDEDMVGLLDAMVSRPFLPSVPFSLSSMQAMLKDKRGQMLEENQELKERLLALE